MSPTAPSQPDTLRAWSARRQPGLAPCARTGSPARRPGGPRSCSSGPQGYGANRRAALIGGGPHSCSSSSSRVRQTPPSRPCDSIATQSYPPGPTRPPPRGRRQACAHHCGPLRASPGVSTLWRMHAGPAPPRKDQVRRDLRSSSVARRDAMGSGPRAVVVGKPRRPEAGLHISTSIS